MKKTITINGKRLVREVESCLNLIGSLSDFLNKRYIGYVIKVANEEKGLLGQMRYVFHVGDATMRASFDYRHRPSTATIDFYAQRKRQLENAVSILEARAGVKLK